MPLTHDYLMTMASDFVYKTIQTPRCSTRARTEGADICTMAVLADMEFPKLYLQSALKNG